MDITGFLEKQGGQFVDELWTLLLDAATQPSGIPYVFIEKKKQELEAEQNKKTKSRFSSRQPPPPPPSVSARVETAGTVRPPDSREPADEVATVKSSQRDGELDRDRDRSRDRGQGSRSVRTSLIS